MADVPLVNRAVESSPKDYTLPQAQEIILKAVTAEIDGTGAAGSYLPALQLISDAGDVMWTALDTGTTVAAGGTQDVSWFPGVKPPAAAAPATSSSLPIASIFNNQGTGTSIAADNAQHYVSMQDGVGGAGFSTTDGTVFSNASTTAFTGSPVYGIRILTTGTYAVLNNAFSLSGGTAGHIATAYWAADNGSAPSFLQQGRSAGATLDSWDAGQAGVGPHTFTTELMTVGVGQTPATLCRYGQVNAGTAVVMSMSMIVVRISTSILAKL